MIDCATEKLIRLDEVPTLDFMPRRRGTGKPTHERTVRRWVEVGLKGVKLETLYVGGIRHTSAEAVQRFFERLSLPGAAPATLTTAQLRKTNEHAHAMLRRLGI